MASDRAFKVDHCWHEVLTEIDSSEEQKYIVLSCGCTNCNQFRECHVKNNVSIALTTNRFMSMAPASNGQL